MSNPDKAGSVNREDVVAILARTRPTLRVRMCSAEVAAADLGCGYTLEERNRGSNSQWQFFYLQVDQSEAATESAREWTNIPEPYNNAVGFCRGANGLYIYPTI